jgi:hypothetical protein
VGLIEITDWLGFTMRPTDYAKSGQSVKDDRINQIGNEGDDRAKHEGSKSTRMRRRQIEQWAGTTR